MAAYGKIETFFRLILALSGVTKQSKRDSTLYSTSLFCMQ